MENRNGLIGYYAMAYRWGGTNQHCYVVAFHPDFGWIERRAEEECQDRGGKYGVAVYGVGENHEPATDILAYYPSTWGERFPSDNPRVKAAESIGFRIIEVLERGAIMAPDPHREGYMASKPVSLPDLVAHEMQRILSDEMRSWEILWSLRIVQLNHGRTVEDARREDADFAKAYDQVRERYQEAWAAIGEPEGSANVGEWHRRLMEESLAGFRRRAPSAGPS